MYSVILKALGPNEFMHMNNEMKKCFELMPSKFSWTPSLTVSRLSSTNDPLNETVQFQMSGY